MRATRLGFRHKSEPAVKALDPHNRPIYWIGPAGAGQDAGPGTDFHAVAKGFVSVTPIKVDLTAHAAIDEGRDVVRALPMNGTTRNDGIGMTSARTRERLIERLKSRRHQEPGRARAHARRAAASVRRRGAREPRLRGHGAADRLRPDDLAAVHRRAMTEALIDRAARSSRACSRSARAAATRRRCSRRSCSTSTASSASQPLLQRARSMLAELRIIEREPAARRRLARLAQPSAVSGHPRRGRAGDAFRPSSASSSTTAGGS